jgi:hypothetical protein
MQNHGCPKGAAGCSIRAWALVERVGVHCFGVGLLDRLTRGAYRPAQSSREVVSHLERSSASRVSRMPTRFGGPRG